ncbi:TPA: hypothetical protein ACH3X3_004929 [Trebouxia sp. C0006]
MAVQVGDHVPVYVAKDPDFRLPKDLGTPIIMAGPGITCGLGPLSESSLRDAVREAPSSLTVSDGHKKLRV